MTRTEKLEWLARNVHEWKQGFDLCVVNPGVGETYVTWPSCCIPSGSTFTKADWRAMRENLQNKPEFADHPDAKCFVQNPDGLWIKGVNSCDAFPSDADNAWALVGQGPWIPISTGKVIGDWRDTLEKRPEMTSKNNDARECEDVPPCKPQDNSWHERGEFPPKWTICDIRVAPNDWIDKVEIVHSKTGQGVVVKLMPSTDVETYLSAVSHKLEFRPLRTEREKAIEHLVEIICQDGDLSKDGVISQTMARRIFDAGFRKEQAK